MAYEYKWAQNQQKLARAILEVNENKKQGAKIDDFEAEVKKVYVRLLGVVLDLDDKKEEKKEEKKKDKKDDK